MPVVCVEGHNILGGFYHLIRISNVLHTVPQGTFSHKTPFSQQQHSLVLQQHLKNDLLILDLAIVINISSGDILS
jgi:hypothetical protein